MSDAFLAGRSAAAARQLRQVAAVLDIPERDLSGYSVRRILEGLADPRVGAPAKLGGVELEVHTELLLQAKSRSGVNYVTQAARGMLIPWAMLHVPPMIASRAEYLSSNTSGSLIEQTMQVNSPIGALYQFMLASELGVVSDPDQVGNVVYPKLAASAGAASTTEGAGAGETEATAAQIVATPHLVESWGSMSRLFRQQSPPGEQMVRADLSRSVAVQIDSLVFNGSGSGGQPTGILNASGTSAVSGTTLDFAHLNTAVADVLDLSAAIGSTGWATCPDVAKLLAQRYEDATTKVMRLWQGSLKRGTVLGELALSSKQIPAATMLYGDFSQVVVPSWGPGLEVSVNPYSGGTPGDFGTGNLTWRAFAQIDVVIRHAQSFAIISSIT